MVATVQKPAPVAVVETPVVSNKVELISEPVKEVETLVEEPEVLVEEPVELVEAAPEVSRQSSQLIKGVNMDDITNLLIAEYVPRKINLSNNTESEDEVFDFDAVPNTWEIVCLMLPMIAVIIGIGVGL